MLLRSGCLLAALALAVNAQSSDTDSQVVGGIEPTDFNVTSALLDLGVDVSELPAAALVERSSDSACSIAVSRRRLR